MKKILILFGCIAISQSTMAQDMTGYQTPPKPLADLVNAPLTPSVSIDAKGQNMLILERNGSPSIAELAQPELRLAGLRINPATNGPSRVPFVNNLKIKSIAGNSLDQQVKNLPTNPQISNVAWSPDDQKIAFIHTTNASLELYVIDVATANASKVTNLAMNGTLGSPIQWVSDSKSLICRTISATRKAAPIISNVPNGPTIQENLGKKAQAATYQDLLKNPSDELLFEYYTNSQTMKIGLDGSATAIGQVGNIASAVPSPDGNFVLIESIHKPYSYLVTVNRFPSKVDVYASTGNLVKTLTDNPLFENVPWGPDAVPTGQRNHDWRHDAPATMYWVEAQDAGDPKKKVEIRDKVFAQAAPFNTQAVELYAATNRFGNITWGNDQIALASERWYATRKTITKIINPSNPVNPVVLFDRSSEDRYNDAGRPEMKQNAFGQDVLDLTANNELYMIGNGASPEGDRPFLDLLNINTKQSKRLWRSEAPYFERVISVLDASKGLVITARESLEEQPNYYIRNLNPKVTKKVTEPVLTQVTNFPHPQPQLKGVQKQQLRYKRNDGVELTATLYLPANYKKENGPLPTFLWAYPAEFKSKEAAGQVSGE